MPQSVKLKDLIRYGFTDPASSQGRAKKTRARQAIIIIAVDAISRIFILYSWAGRIAASKYIEKIIEVCQDYEPRRFGVEANSMQSLFFETVRDKARETVIQTLPLVGINQPPKAEKDYRIRTTIEPALNQGRIFLQERHVELEAELRGFPTAATKDLVDCLASAMHLIPARSVPAREKDEITKLAKYLRDTGAPPWYIEKRIAEIHGS